MTRESELLEQRIISVWYTASKVHDTFLFLRGICREITSKVRRIANDQLKNFLVDTNNQIKNAENKEHVKDVIEELLIELTYQKIRVILLIDEFDAVQSYMTEDDFGFLRTITYELDKKICIVTTSRKAIKDIEAVSGAVSNFYGTFDTLRLGLYDEDSIEDYWEWVNDSQPPFCVDEKYKQNAVNIVGTHPFLLDFYNYNNWLLEDDKGMESNKQDFHIQLIDIFNTMQDTLAKEKLLDAAIQLVVGPVMNVTSDHANKLEAYDFIVKTSVEMKAEILGNHYGLRYLDGQDYVCFSCFSPYLTSLFAYQHLFDIPYWAEWQETEMRVRGVIKKYIETLGPDWEEQLLNRFGSDQNWLNNFNALKSLRSRTLKRFHNASQNLVDYTLPANMYSMFIGPAWGDYFANIILGGTNKSGDRDEWRRTFQFLSDVRNPIAHSNEVFIEQDEINQAKLYCKAIINAINQWEERLRTH